MDFEMKKYLLEYVKVLEAEKLLLRKQACDIAAKQRIIQKFIDENHIEAEVKEEEKVIDAWTNHSQDQLANWQAQQMQSQLSMQQAYDLQSQQLRNQNRIPFQIVKLIKPGKTE